MTFLDLQNPCYDPHTTGLPVTFQEFRNLVPPVCTFLSFAYIQNQT
jgi:hypothetical protein